MIEGEFESKVAIGIIIETFKESVKGIKKFDIWVKKKSKGFDPFGLAVKKYISKIHERYAYVRIFSMAKPVAIRDILVDVNILDKRTSEFQITVENLNKIYAKNPKFRQDLIKRISGISAINETGKVIVYGKPGAGKTTFLKSIILKSIDGDLTTPLVPIYLSLKDWSDSNQEIFEYITHEFDVCDFPDAEIFLNQLLSKGKAIILFDGLDEVTKNRDSAIRQIETFSAKFSKNKFVLSCRIAAREYVFKDFTEIEIEDFNKKQINKFISNWFSENPIKRDACTKSIFSNESIFELATIPLLLTMLCVTFDELMDFPINKSELYKEALDALLKKWDSSRNIKRDIIYKRLSNKRKEEMLSVIAYKTFTNGEYFISQNRLEKIIEKYIENIPNISREELDDPDGFSVLKSIESHHGLLVTRARRIYSFSHLTFQEFFTAKYIVDHYNDRLVQDLLIEKVLDRKWSEVYILISGLLVEADHFLFIILNETERISKNKTFVLAKGIIDSYEINPKENSRLMSFLNKENFENVLEIIKSYKNRTVKNQQYVFSAHLRDCESKLIKLNDEKISKTLGKRIDATAEKYELFVNYNYLENLLEVCYFSDCYITIEARNKLKLFFRKSSNGVLMKYFMEKKEDVLLSEYLPFLKRMM